MGTLILRHIHTLNLPQWQELVLLFSQRSYPWFLRLVLTSEQPVPKEIGWPLSEIQVPALHEHAEDCIHLIQYLVPTCCLGLDVVALLERYEWPSNIAELRHVVERAAALADPHPVEPQHLPARLHHTNHTDPEPFSLPASGLSLEAVEISLIRQALARTGGNKTHAADLLGLTHHTLLYRLETYGIKLTESAG